MTEAEIETVLTALADGKPLRSVLRNGRAIVRFFAAIEGTAWAAQYARVAGARAEQAAHEVLTIADRNDLEPRDKQVRIAARQWYAGVTKPSKYGPKLELNHVGRIDLVASMAESDARLAALTPVRHLPTSPQAQDVDWEPISADRSSDATSDARSEAGPDAGVGAGAEDDAAAGD